MSNKNTISLKSLVEQKVDEAWYNNLNDFYHGVGKCATIGALGTLGTIGAAHEIGKGLDNQERYEQGLNQQAIQNSNPSEVDYQEWCKQHSMNPNDANSLSQYNNFTDGDDVDEGRIRNIVRRTIVESLARDELKKALS